MNSLHTYLARVAHELRSHLEQRVEDFVSRGFSPETAQAHVLHEFGSARSVGSKLCDAWEGIPFSCGRVAASFFAVSLLWFVTQSLLHKSLFYLAFFPDSAYAALLPELPYIWALVLFSTPFDCGILFSLWLGRRGRLASAALFGAMWALSLLPPRPSTLLPSLLTILSGNAVHISGTSPLPLPFVYLLLAVTGASLSNTIRIQRLKLALTNGSVLQVHPQRPLAPRFKSAALAGAFIAILGLLGWGRVHTALHPSTPEGVLRASLLTNRGMNSGDFQPLTNLEMRELAPKTSAERAGREKRIFFRAQASATKQYAARRIAFIQKELRATKAHKQWIKQPLLASLERLRQNRHTVQVTVRLVQTPDGWKVDENSFDRSQLWAWCYDLYYDSNS